VSTRKKGASRSPPLMPGRLGGRRVGYRPPLVNSHLTETLTPFGPTRSATNWAARPLRSRAPSVRSWQAAAALPRHSILSASWQRRARPSPHTVPWSNSRDPCPACRHGPARTEGGRGSTARMLAASAKELPRPGGLELVRKCPRRPRWPPYAGAPDGFAGHRQSTQLRW
jgi:hypothetical protein